MRRAAALVGLVLAGCLDDRPLDPSLEPATGELSPATAWLEPGDSLTLDTGGAPAALRASPSGVIALAGRTARAIRPGTATVEALFPVGRREARLTVVPPAAPLAARGVVEGLTETSLLGIWSANAQESFAVGTGGVVLRTVDGGAHWTVMAVPSEANFTAVWGSGPDNVFVVGSEGTILRWNGQQWRRMATPIREALLDVWGLDATHVYAVGVDAILAYDGLFWETMPVPAPVELWSVWGTAPDDLFATGQNGDLLHWDGTLWRRMTSPTPYVLFGLWGSSSTDVYAVGIRGLVLHYDGRSWRQVTVPSRADFFAIQARTPNDIMVVGNNGAVVIFNGAAWTQAPQTASNENLRAIAVDPTGRALVAGWSGTVIERGQNGWRSLVTSPILLSAVAGQDGATYTVGAAGTLLRRRAGGIDRIAIPTRRDLYGIAQRADGTLMAVGDTGTVITSADGVRWSLEAAPTSVLLRSIWADRTDPNLVYVVGAEGTILKRSAAGWSVVPSPTNRFFRHVTGAGPGEVFAVGDSGTVVRSTGGGFVQMPTPITDRLRGVWANGPDDVIAVGENGAALRFDGRRWYRVSTEVTVELRAVAGLGPTRTYAVGQGGTVLRFDGVRFRPVATTTASLLLGATVGANRIIAVGTNQTIVDLAP